MPKSSNPGKKPVKKNNNVQKVVKQTKAVVKSTTTELSAGDFLLEREKLVATYMANGFSDKEIIGLFGLDNDELANMKKNPNLIKFRNEKIMTVGMADKMQRISSVNFITGALKDEFLKRIVNGDLDKMSASTIWSMMLQGMDKIETLLGEDKSQEQSLTVLIMEQVKNRSNNKKNKTDKLEDYNPDDDFPVIDISEVK